MHVLKLIYRSPVCNKLNHCLLSSVVVCAIYKKLLQGGCCPVLLLEVMVAPEGQESVPVIIISVSTI